MTLLLLLAMQVALPPLGSKLPFGAVEVVNPIAPAVRRYENCIRKQLEARGALPNINPATYRPAAEASISACVSVRKSAMLEAEAALSKAPDYKDDRRRSQAIKHAFDGTDFQRREFAEILLRQFKKQK